MEQEEIRTINFRGQFLFALVSSRLSLQDQVLSAAGSAAL
jgi:hypothetical protein